MLQVRKSNEEDIQDLAISLAMDEHHAGQKVEDWTGAGGELMTFYDEDGILFHLRLERVVRVHLQVSAVPEKRRLGKGMAEAITWLKGKAASHYREIIFSSSVEPLVKFFEKFGFKKSPEENKVLL